MPILEDAGTGDWIKISFYLNSLIHDDITEEDKGMIYILNCFSYNQGS